MRHLSDRRRRRILETKPIRDAYLSSATQCDMPGCRNLPDHCHEIARGSFRDKALDKLYAILRLCPSCHRDVHGGTSLEAQYAIKKISDPDNYDRVALNRLRGRQDEAITEDEVDFWVLRIDPRKQNNSSS